MTVRVVMGSAVVTVMTTEQEAILFKLFGGEIADLSLLQPTDIPTLDTIHQVDSLRYLASGGDVDIVESGKGLQGFRFSKEGIVLQA